MNFMKKICIALFLLICVLLSACGAVEPETTTAGSSETAASETETGKSSEKTTTGEITTARTSETTEEPRELYYGVYGIPGVYRLNNDGSMTEAQAAEILVNKMLDAMLVPDEGRAFCLLEYSDVEIAVHPSSDALTPGTPWGIFPDSPVIAENTYLVYFDASFRYSGVYSPIGPSIDESRWWTSLGNGITPLVLLETENEYLMWWESAYALNDGKGIPPEAEGLFVY